MTAHLDQSACREVAINGDLFCNARQILVHTVMVNLTRQQALKSL